MAQIPFNPAEIERTVVDDATKQLRAMVNAASQTAVLATPVGNPALWQSPAPPDYRPGNARANWFLQVGSLGQPDDWNPAARAPVGSGVIARLRKRAAGIVTATQRVSLYNPAPHAGPLDAGIASRQGSAMTLKAQAAALAVQQGRQNL